MAGFDISLLGKRYPELNPTTFLEIGDIIALYRTGQPELNRVTWLEIQKSLSLINTADFIGASFANGQFPRWSTNKFIPGGVILSDIPNLPASIITSGIFSETLIPALPISRITNLQAQIDSKESIFSKGDVVSSTLALTGNLGRLFGSGDLGIEIDTNIFSNLFIPATRTMTFNTNGTVLINGLTTYVKDLNNPLDEVDLAVNIIPYVHPSGYLSQPNGGPLTGADVISQITITDEGHVEGLVTRALTKADIGLGNVDDTSDLNKPISTATQNAIDDLDNRFLRKDANDNNGTFTLTLANLAVSTAVSFTGLPDEINPDYALVMMLDGSVRRSTIVTTTDISDLQTQIDGLQTQIDDVVQDKNWVHIQGSLASIWTVNHGLGKECCISVFDSSGNSVRYAIDNALSNLDTTVLVFLTPITGKAIFN